MMDPTTMIPWLDHIEMVAEKTGIDPLKVGISRLKGLAMGDINAIHKESTLTWYSFRQRITEHYLNVPYALDAMFAYSHLSQGKEELIVHYLSRAKVLLVCIHYMTKLSSVPGVGWDNLYLVRGLRAPPITRMLASEQDFWRMIEDVFDTISCIARTEDRKKIYLEPNF